MAGRIQGVLSLKRLLRRLPDVARQELGEELRDIGVRLLINARMETPVRKGALRRVLNYTVLVKSLQLRLGLIKKADRSRFFYGYILDQGRAAKTVKAKRRKQDGSYSSYMMKVSPIAQSRYEFVFGRRRDFQDNEVPRLRAVLNRILARAGQGVGHD